MMGITTLVDEFAGLKFTESPRWHEGKLWFLDIHDRSIKKVDLEGALETVLELPFLPNGLGFMPNGHMVFGNGLERMLYTYNGQEYTLLADISSLAKNCLSDGIVDAKGRIYIGDMGYNFLEGAEPVPEGSIVMVGVEGRASTVAEKLFFPNGMVITPDGKTLIVAESYGHCLSAFDIREDGSLYHRRVFAALNEDIFPDGICLDAEGAIWVATVGPVLVRVHEGGEITERIDLPKNFSFAAVFGGPDRKHLFISTSHSHDPVEIHQNPCARIEFIETDVPGAGIP